MADPRNVAHAKKVSQEKHHKDAAKGGAIVQPDKKPRRWIDDRHAGLAKG